MTGKIRTDKLTGVPETMLIPLYGRAAETARADAIIRDPAAVEMMTHIDYDFTRFADSHATNTGIAVRTEIFDELAADFIARYPTCVVVNLGAGLDTRFTRLDNGRLNWYELDLPEAMAIRQQLIIPGERHHFIIASALDFSWIDRIEARPAVLIIAEGLLMYFAEAQVKSLLTTLAARLPKGAEALIEVMGVSQAQNTHRNDAVSKTSAAFKWGIRQTSTLAEWDARIHYVTDISLYDRYPERWLALDIDWPAPLDALRNTVNRIVHLRFG